MISPLPFDGTDLAAHCKQCAPIGPALIRCDDFLFEAYMAHDKLNLNWTFDDPAGLFGILVELEPPEVLRWLRQRGQPLSDLVWRELQTADLSQIPPERMRSFAHARAVWRWRQDHIAEDPTRPGKGHDKAALLLPA